MIGTVLNAILTMQPGDFYRGASDFFGRSEAGETFFLPSGFRLPWHAKHARVVILALKSGIGKDDDPAFLTLFGLYAVRSLWAFLESTMVLRRRMRTRRAVDPAESNEPKTAAEDAGPVRSGALHD